MLITKELILKNKTKNGAWTRDQLQALGVKWPPKHGWMKRIIGKPISSDNLHRLEEKVSAKEARSRSKDCGEQFDIVEINHLREIMAST